MFRIGRVAPRDALDADFYTAFYSDLQGFTERQAHQHWKKFGRPEGRFPNAGKALEIMLADKRLPAFFDIERHREEAARSREIRWDFQIVTHVLDGIAEREAERQRLAAAEDDGNTLTQGHLRELPDTFNLATYLARNGDVRAASSDPVTGVLHYLRHGRAEGRSFLPDSVDFDFVESTFRVAVPRSMNADQVAAFVRRQRNLPVTALIFLSERELFWFHGIRNPQVLEGFDPEYYWLVAHPDADAAIDRFAAMLHFCEVGQFAASDVSGTLKFDHAFYDFEYGSAGRWVDEDGADATRSRRQALFADWLASNGPDLRYPNLEVWAKAKFGFDICPAVERQVRQWQGTTTMAAGKSRTTSLLRPLIDGDLEAILAIGVTDESVADCLATVADHLTIAGSTKLADAIFAHILFGRPHNARALRHRADQAQRYQLHGLTASLREEIIASRRADVWTYLTLADCLQSIGMDDRATDVLLRSAEAFPSDVALRRKAEKAATEAFGELWERSTALAMREGTASAQNQIGQALARCTPRFDPPQRHRTIERVALYANCDLPQCRFYRVEQKVEQLRAAGFDVLVFEYTTGTADYLQALPRVDLTVAYRLPAFPHVIDALKRTSDLGIPTIYDMDDLVFEASEFPPDLASYDGHISAEHHASMACGVPLFAHAMSLCDYAMASTEALRRFMEPRVRTGVSFLHPNALGDLHMRYAGERPPPADDTVRIFYGSATKAHKADFRDIVEPALAAVFARFGDRVRVLLVGSINLSPLLDGYRGSIEVVEPTSQIEDFWDLLQSADINLSVLSRSTFNDCKSEIKWLEAAMMGIPSVVSRSTTFEDVIVEGRNGFMCDDADGFGAALLRLVGDPALREAVGRAARQDTLARYGRPAMVENWKRVVAAIEARLPAPRPRVLIVNVFYPPQAIGGATRVVHDNVRDLVQRYGDRFEVSVLCTLDGGLKPYEIDWYGLDGVHVMRIATPDRPDVDRVLDDPRMGAAFARCLDTLEPDLVHFHSIQRLTTSVVDVVKRRDIPFVVTMHDGWWISPNQFILGRSGEPAFYDFAAGADGGRAGQLPDRARVLRRCLQSAACVTAVSPQFADVCRATGFGEVVAIENGLSSVPAVARSQAGERVRLGHLGGTELHKGLPLLRAVLHATPFRNLSLTVVELALEPGSSRSEIWGTTPVTIRARARRDEMPDVYGAIDVLVAPSIWPESFGLVTREAVASGCWVLASDRGAVGACVVDGRNGFVVEVDTPRGLRDALARIDADPERFKRPPDYAFPIRPAADQAAELADLYDRLIAARAGRAAVEGDRLATTGS